MQTIVISAVNLRSGGPLSVLKDCLKVLNDLYSDHYNIVALVNRKDLFPNYGRIQFIEFPNSASSYFVRIYLEYFYFKKLSEKINPYLWFSLHDMTPNVTAVKRAVYCHNPSPFYTLSFREAWLQPKFFLFNLLYEFVYSVNIKKNDYVVVQQSWLRSEFVRRFGVNNVVVSYPSLDSILDDFKLSTGDKPDYIKKFIFIYPSFPRVFKNIEVLGEAVKLLNQEGIENFEVWLSMDGTENKYATRMVLEYAHLKQIKFLGLQAREIITGEWYQHSNALLFPSKLETWGLPITEFKLTGKPMLVADLPYAHETVGDYDAATFFRHNDAQSLAEKMITLIQGCFRPEGNRGVVPESPFVKGWQELFSYILRSSE